MDLVYRIAAFIWGLWTLNSYTILAVFSTENWRTRSPEEHEELRRASHALWSLPTSTSSNALQHNFLKLPGGLQLHYLTSTTASSHSAKTKIKTLVVFLHGFPDSCHLFSPFLQSPALASRDHVKLVSLDLPGFGGSDSLAHYGPDEVLDAVVEGISELKAQYLEQTDDARCILVGHDWGGIVAARIAAETEGLVSRVVMLNSAYAPAAASNAKAYLTRTRESLSRWTKEPRNLAFLRSAWAEFTPVMMQLMRSAYIFMFNLPYGHLARDLPFLSHFQLNYVYRHGHHRSNPNIASLAHSEASSTGPSLAEAESYGPSVTVRAGMGTAVWDERIKLYKQGLANGHWKSRSAEAEKFKCPMTILFGMQDPALDFRMVLDGIEKYFGGEVGEQSQIVRLRDCGHWSMLEPVGAEALVGTLEWLLRSDEVGVSTLKEALRNRDELDGEFEVSVYDPA